MLIIYYYGGLGNNRREKRELVYSFKKHHISDYTLHRLKHNKDISTKTINDLCHILNCNVSDILTYKSSEDDQKL